MKSFFKYLLATIVGIVLSFLIIVMIFAGIASHFSGKEKPVKIENHSILYLKLDDPIADRNPNTNKFFPKNTKFGLPEVLDNIKKAKEDPNIDGIHLDLSIIPSGLGIIEEIRNALLDFKKSGKFVTAYSETYTQGSYYLATACDKIYLHPMGFFNFVGLRASGVFFKNALKKLDIEPTIIRCGAYKSFGEMITDEKFSDPNREQLRELITSIWTDLCSKISLQRGIPVAKLNEIADKLLIKDAKSAYELKFVDSLIYRDQLLSILKKKTSIDESKDLHAVTLKQYARVPKAKTYKGIAKNKIAVVYALGDIYPGEGSENSIGSDKFGKAIREARRDSSIKAIVVRVNSPGGSALASEVIWRELYLARQAKPVVVSMGDVAASGGYYISCVADSVFTEPNTITGSIGVIGMLLNTKGFFNKLGITFDVEKTNEYSDFMSGVRTVKPAEYDYWRYATDEIYATFLDRVASGRHITTSEVSKIAQGRIWTGTDALKIKLVDKIGGLNDAIETAKNMAHLDEKYRIVELPELENPFQKFINEFSEEVKIKLLGNKLGLSEETANQLKNAVENQGILTRMPVDLSIQ